MVLHLYIAIGLPERGKSLMLVLHPSNSISHLVIVAFEKEDSP